MTVNSLSDAGWCRQGTKIFSAPVEFYAAAELVASLLYARIPATKQPAMTEHDVIATREAGLSRLWVVRADYEKFRAAFPDVEIENDPGRLDWGPGLFGV